MKSLFKRALASATGSVLLFSQLAATAVNVNAADASDLTIDKAWVTEVPVDELPTVDVLPISIDGAPATNESLVWGESNWNDKLDTAVGTAVGDKGSVTKDFAASKLKDAIKKRLAATRYFTDEQAQRAVDLLTNGKVTLNANGTVTATIELSDATEIFAEIAEAKWVADGFNAAGDVTIDWSGFSLTGTATLDVDFSKYDKTASYKITVADDKGTYDTLEKIAGYVNDKFAEALEYVVAQAKAQNDSPRLEAAAADYAAKAAKSSEIIAKLAKAIDAVSVEGTDLEATYADYLAAVDAAIKSVNEPESRIVKKAQAELAKAPETFTGALTGERAGKWIDAAVDAANKFADGKVTVDLSSADVAAILNEGYDYTVKFPNGYSFDAEFSIPDDEDVNAQLMSDLQAAYGADWEAENLVLVSVETHKEVTVNAETAMGLSSTNLFFDIVRVIDVVNLETVVPTTTESTTTSSETTSSETTSSETTSSETTSSETTSSETTSSETTSSETTSSETTSSETTSSETTSSETTSSETTSSETTSSETTSSETTSSETTSSETTSSETTSSETTSSETTSSETTSSETTSSETTSSETTTSETTTSGTTTEPIVTDAEGNVYELNFEADGMPKQLVYWSEETTAFDFTNLAVKMYLDVTDKDGFVSSKEFDVTAAFDALQKNPQDFEFKGFGVYAIQVALKDLAAVEKALSDDGLNADVIADLEKKYKVAEGKLADINGQIPVVLVLRGDASLDNKVDTDDAIMSLIYFTMSSIGSTKEDFATSKAFANNYVDVVAYLPYGHYAADTSDGNGYVDSDDAIRILKYYTMNVVIGMEGTDWSDEGIVGTDVTPLETLHVDPLTYEAYEG